MRLTAGLHRKENRLGIARAASAIVCRDLAGALRTRRRRLKDDVAVLETAFGRQTFGSTSVTTTPSFRRRPRVGWGNRQTEVFGTPGQACVGATLSSLSVAALPDRIRQLAEREVNDRGSWHRPPVR